MVGGEKPNSKIAPLGSETMIASLQTEVTLRSNPDDPQKKRDD